MYGKRRQGGFRDQPHSTRSGGLARLLLLLVLLLAIGGAIAVAIVDIPPPTRLIEAEAQLSGASGQ